MRLKLNDGTVLENCRAGYADGNLWLFLTGVSMQYASALFFDPARTVRIVFEYGEMQDVYEGFTKVTALIMDGDGMSVCLKKGA